MNFEDYRDLTQQERKILDVGLKHDLTDTEIAERLDMTTEEVKAAIESLCKKLDLPDRMALAASRKEGIFFVSIDLAKIWREAQKSQKRQRTTSKRKGGSTKPTGR